MIEGKMKFQSIWDQNWYINIDNKYLSHKYLGSTSNVTEIEFQGESNKWYNFIYIEINFIFIVLNQSFHKFIMKKDKIYQLKNIKKYIFSLI